MEIILAFAGGAVVGAIIMFFVYHNNPKWGSKAYDILKAEFDEKEKALRELREKLAIEEAVKKAIDGMTKKL